MIYTISDFINDYRSDIRLVAGEGGLARPIREVGILDYELVPGLTQRYQRKNFLKDQLILSTFLYARDSPYLVTEAVRHLVSVGASGLVIKNVFHLDIPEAALRCAKARNFPLMLASMDSFYFDEVILRVGTRVKELENASHLQREFDALLEVRYDEAEVERRARVLNPSFGDEYVMLYASLADDLTSQQLVAVENAYYKSHLASVQNMLAVFEKGLLLVVSGEGVGRQKADEAATYLRADIPLGCDALFLGVSEPHHSLGEFAMCLLEAIHATRVAEFDQASTVFYQDLGALRAILPHAFSPAMCSFSQSILGPIQDFDVENNARLVETLEAFVRNDQSVTKAAQYLQTHPNTVRYRMSQVARVTGTDWRKPTHMEQLSLACAIRLAQNIAWQP